MLYNWEFEKIKQKNFEWSGKEERNDFYITDNEESWGITLLAIIPK